MGALCPGHTSVAESQADYWQSATSIGSVRSKGSTKPLLAILPHAFPAETFQNCTYMINHNFIRGGDHGRDSYEYGQEHLRLLDGAGGKRSRVVMHFRSVLINFPLWPCLVRARRRSAASLAYRGESFPPPSSAGAMLVADRQVGRRRLVTVSDIRHSIAAAPPAPEAAVSDRPSASQVSSLLSSESADGCLGLVALS